MKTQFCLFVRIVVLTASALAWLSLIAGCGAEAGIDVDQLVHEGPIAEPRPPRPVALEIASGEPVRFAPGNGEVSSRMARPEGRVIDVAMLDDRVWWVVERTGERRVTAVGRDGAVRWSRPILHASGVLALGSGGVVVFTERTWWALGDDGGVLWRAPGRPVRAAWSHPTGGTVVAAAQPEETPRRYELDDRGVRLEGGPLEEAERYVAIAGGASVLGVGLRGGELQVTFPDGGSTNDLEFLSIPWPRGEGLSAATLVPGRVGEPVRIVLVRATPPALGLLTLGDVASLTSSPLPDGASDAAVAPELWASADRVVVGSGAGLRGYDLVAADAQPGGWYLKVDDRFDGRHLRAPLAGP